MSETHPLYRNQPTRPSEPPEWAVPGRDVAVITTVGPSRYLRTATVVISDAAMIVLDGPSKFRRNYDGRWLLLGAPKDRTVRIAALDDPEVTALRAERVVTRAYLALVEVQDGIRRVGSANVTAEQAAELVAAATRWSQTVEAREARQNQQPEVLI